MGSFQISPKGKVVKVKGEPYKFRLYSKGQLNKFNPKLLNLRNIEQPSTQVEAIAAVFDLSGFTNFCKQVDPQLCVPKYLNKFLIWLFEEIRNSLIEKKFGNDRLLYTDLPFFAKFLGDGVLFLWDVKNLNMGQMCNVLVMLRNICLGYSKKFVTSIKKYFTEIPPHLRCGVARGTVYSIGKDDDYVGPCINIASRLQKLSRLTFCFDRRGLDFEEGMLEDVAPHYTVKSVAIRGIGDNELVCVRRAEFERLPKREKALFKDV